jgi:excisionase family DNA binding protein
MSPSITRLTRHSGPPPKVYTLKAAAEYLHIGLTSLYELMNSGELGYVQVRSRKRVITEEQIAEFLRRNGREAA